VNDDVALLLTAAIRARIKFSGMTEEDAGKAGKLTILMRYVLNTIWGLSWIRELSRTANYYLADTPAVALLRIWWRREMGLRLTKVTTDALLEDYIGRVRDELAGLELAPEQIEQQTALAAQDFMTALQTPGVSDEYLESIIVEFWPHVRPARAKKMVKQLR
jgi:hypothetical protein